MILQVVNHRGFSQDPVATPLGAKEFVSDFHPKEKLGGGFKYFLFSPRNLGKMNPF